MAIDSTFRAGSTLSLGTSSLRDRLLRRLEELMDGALSREEISQIAQGLVASARVDVALDPWMVAWGRDTTFCADAAGVVDEYVQARADFLEEEIQNLQTIHGPLVINEVQTHNTGQHLDDHGEADPWIELYNRGTEAVSLHGLCLIANLRSPDEAHCFEGALEIDPGEFLVLFADGQPNQGTLHLGFAFLGLAAVPAKRHSDVTAFVLARKAVPEAAREAVVAGSVAVVIRPVACLVHGCGGCREALGAQAIRRANPSAEGLTTVDGVRARFTQGGPELVGLSVPVVVHAIAEEG